MDKKKIVRISRIWKLFVMDQIKMLSLILLKRNLLTCKLLPNFGMTVHCLGSGFDIWLFPIPNLTFEKNNGFFLY